MSEVVDEVVETAPEQVIVTVDSHGRLQGDTSHLPQEIVDQFNNPEVQKKIAAQYKQAHGTGRREMRKQEEDRLANRQMAKSNPTLESAPSSFKLAESLAANGIGRLAQRSFVHLKPAGMSTKQFTRQRKQMFRYLKKNELRRSRQSQGEINGNETISDSRANAELHAESSAA